MKRRAASGIAFAFFLLFFPAVLTTTASGGEVLVLKVEGDINPIVSRYVTRNIEHAARDRMELVVVELDTPGGLWVSMNQIVEKILGSPVPVAVYVYPPGARAASAGLFVAMAAHVSAMAPGTNMGAAHPVAAGGGEVGGVMGRKVLNDAAAKIRALAQLRGRNAEWAEEAVRESVSLPEAEALRDKVIDLVAPDLAALLSAVDGRKVSVAGGGRTLDTAGPAVTERGMAWTDRFLAAIVNPNLAYALFIIGIFGIVFELAAPGFGGAGIVGGLAMLLSLVAFGNLPTNLAGLFLIVFAAVLFFLDVKAPSHGVLTAGGIACMLFGSLLLFPPWAPRTLPGSRPLRISPALIGTMTALTAAFFAFAVASGVRAQRRRVVTGPESLGGSDGVALSDVGASGIVRVGGEEWSAFTDGERIPAGETVTVRDVVGIRLKVDRKRAAPR
jgi:membrane-bound serine protease (ClpP class)